MQGASALVRDHSPGRASKVPRVLSLEFRVVRLYRTFSTYSFTGETRCAGCLGTSSGWFMRIEPPRTFLNHFLAELSRCLVVFPHAFGVVQLYRTFSSYNVTGETRCAGCFCTRSGWFKHSEPPPTVSNHSSAGIARCVALFHRSSGWFYCTEPPLTSALQTKGVQGA